MPAAPTKQYSNVNRNPAPSNTVQATYTGGAPGTPTYAWSVPSNTSPGPVALGNPVNASSQIAVFTGLPFTPANTIDSYSATLQVVVTDPLGNASLAVQRVVVVQIVGNVTPGGG